jgi:hypothetical protein
MSVDRIRQIAQFKKAERERTAGLAQQNDRARQRTRARLEVATDSGWCSLHSEVARQARAYNKKERRDSLRGGRKPILPAAVARGAHRTRLERRLVQVDPDAMLHGLSLLSCPEHVVSTNMLLGYDGATAFSSNQTGASSALLWHPMKVGSKLAFCPSSGRLDPVRLGPPTHATRETALRGGPALGTALATALTTRGPANDSP